MQEKADEEEREGTGPRYIATRHAAEANNGVLIKKYILGRARLSGSFSRDSAGGHVVLRDRKKTYCLAARRAKDIVKDCC